MMPIYLNRYMTDQLDTIDSCYRHLMGTPTETTIHELRVALRRLKPALKILIHLESHTKKQRQLINSVNTLDQLFKILSRPRDLQVQAELSDAFIHEQPQFETILGPYINELKHQIQILHQTLLQQVIQLNIPTTIRRLQDNGQHPVKEKQSAQLIQSQRQKYKAKLQQSLRALHSCPEQFHQTRIQLKKYRYALELYTATTGAHKQKRIQRLKDIQDALGTANDLHNAIQLMQFYQVDIQAITPIQQRYIDCRTQSIQELFKQF
ncbi:CHAD domain-containing protein [Celerinatantimonas sp. YJH-8]|uniref:CHAD domain-containing protein n=1 Tax=Celerinatantimonas sp. YJH-8 TaxID=3228714 RepID=UPI0038BE22F2